MKRFLAIDALRGVLALCVAVGHAGVFPLFGPVGQADPTLDLLARGLRTMVFGPPAVIAFFVISGFCIHYPYAVTGQSSPALRFFCRRYVRILVPIVGAVALFKWLLPQTVIFGDHSILWQSTLWSVVCEEIYYALYPALNRLAPRFGWPPMIGAAFVLSAVVVAATYPTVDWKEVGVIGTALTLLPVWLLGCWLADQVSTLALAVSPRAIWCWRGGAWAAMWLQLVLHFHSSIHQTVSGVVLGVFCYYWLRAEIAYSRQHAPWALLAWSGRWSYSLYLIHPIVIGLFAGGRFIDLQTRGGWTLGMACILAASYVFYLAIERPSHRLARRIPMFEPVPVPSPAV